MRLFPAENPLRERFPRSFLQTLPGSPGVYYFRDAGGRLLYIGQSHNLRQRVGSYRQVHPDRDSRRLVRLVHEIRSVDWEVCATSAAAIERERELLLELRPGFNRAGVWSPPPWWLVVRVPGGGKPSGLQAAEPVLVIGQEAPLLPGWGGLDALTTTGPGVWGDGVLVLDLTTHPPEMEAGGDAVVLGPHPASFRWVHAVLLRSLYRWLFPDVTLADFPPGLMTEKAPRSVQWLLTEAVLSSGVMNLLRDWLLGQGEAGCQPELIQRLTAMIPETMAVMERTFWREQVEILANYGAHWAGRAAGSGQ